MEGCSQDSRRGHFSDHATTKYCDFHPNNALESFRTTQIREQLDRLMYLPIPLHFDRWAEKYNYIEVGLWPVLGIILAVYGFSRQGVVRRDCLFAAVILIVFGASDWFEANTGNEWWHPWWLLLWKAACVIALFALMVHAYRRKKPKSVDGD